MKLVVNWGEHTGHFLSCPQGWKTQQHQQYEQEQTTTTATTTSSSSISNPKEFINELIEECVNPIFQQYGVHIGDTYTFRVGIMSVGTARSVRIVGKPVYRSIDSKFLESTIPTTEIKRDPEQVFKLCEAMEHAKTVTELLELYEQDHVKKGGYFEPIGMRMPHPPRIPDLRGYWGALEGVIVHPILLTMDIPRDGLVVVKQTESGMEYVELTTVPNWDPYYWIYMHPSKFGCVYVAPIVTSNDRLYTVKLLLHAASDVNNRLHIQDPEESLSMASLCHKFQSQSSEIEGVVVLDDVISEDLHMSLARQVDALASKQEQDGTIYYRPESNHVIRDVIHPALDCYVNGVTTLRSLMDDNENYSPCIFPAMPKRHTQEDGEDFWRRLYRTSQYQCLPTYFRISMGGKCTIEDYIAHLTPRDDALIIRPLYDSLSRLFEQCLPFIESVFSYVQGVGPILYNPRGSEDLAASPDVIYYPLRGQCLQVFTKIIDYEIRDGRDYEGSAWQVEGMPQEEVVLTALYILDNQDDDIQGGTMEFKRPFLREEARRLCRSTPATKPTKVIRLIGERLVPLGTTRVCQKGRLIVFPNSHVHRITKMIYRSAMALASNEDALNRVAKCRMVVFSMVNPMRRIASTREVAPQQDHSGGTMTRDDALRYRLELMEERDALPQDWYVRGSRMWPHDEEEEDYEENEDYEESIIGGWSEHTSDMVSDMHDEFSSTDQSAFSEESLGSEESEDSLGSEESDGNDGSDGNNGSDGSVQSTNQDGW